MKSISKLQSLTNWTPIEIVLAMLFLISPLYYQPNLGGRGLELPFNFGVWFVAFIVITAAIFSCLKTRQIYFPKQYLAIMLFPALIFVSSILSGIVSPIEWLFREIYIWTGVLFLFALFQYREKINLNRLLFILVISGLVHSFISLLQMNHSLFLNGWYPYSISGAPIGVFQQVNVNATYLVTATLVAFYLQGHDYITQGKFWKKTTLILAIGLSTYVIFASGSRIGLLSLTVSLCILLWSYRHRYKNNYKLILLSLVVIGVSAFTAKGGLEKTIDKNTKMVEQEYSDARESIYTISLMAIQKSPIVGHGIGGFLKAWNNEVEQFYQENPGAVLPQYIGHPHNELLFWAIEGGVLALLGIFSIVIVVTISLLKLGLEQGGAYFSLLLPISLHSQVELPFYISSSHWFVVIFIVSLILNPTLSSRNFSLSLSAEWLVRFVTAIGLLIVTYFLYNTARAQSDIVSFVNQQSSPPYLGVAARNIYTSEYAEQLARRNNLYAAINRNDQQAIQKFIAWAESRLLVKPELKIYEDILTAYMHRQDVDNKCKTIFSASKMYPKNRSLSDLREQCKTE
ncbi:hypothetical protein A9Q78_11220 [Methylophaga sp. 41_12_T18]|nr:hypothetical protein A9Q78_11220 [Methylophaga sp. 41_12_T18]